MNELVSELKVHPMNERIYGIETVDEAFISSVREKGILVPLAIKHDGTIVSGHRRWRAAVTIGMQTVPVEVVSYDTEFDEQEAIIEFNRQREKTFSQKMAEAEVLKAVESERARVRMSEAAQAQRQGRETFPTPETGRTRDKVASTIGLGSGRTFEKAAKVWEAAKQGDETAKKAVQALDEGTVTIGKAYKEVAKQQEKTEREHAAQKADEVAVLAVEQKPQVQLGQWWKLGKHRLYCGDTSEEAFKQQLPSAAFAFADPPYNAGVAEWDEGFEWRHDWLIEKAQIVVVTPGTNSIFRFARTTRMPYRWSLACWIDNGMTRGALGFANWIYAALFAKGDVYRNAQDFVRVSIKTSESGETQHKGRKPSEFIAWLIGLFTKQGDSVIDPFLGSGTTLLVAEEMGRVCYGGEISPEFCADIIARWEKQTGRKAEEMPCG